MASGTPEGYRAYDTLWGLPVSGAPAVCFCGICVPLKLTTYHAADEQGQKKIYHFFSYPLDK